MRKKKSKNECIETSPCKTCLISPCCTNICEEKIIFTTEKLVRLAIFYNVETCDVLKNKPAFKYLENIREENRTIHSRIGEDARILMRNSICDTFQKIKEKINQEIQIEGPEKNKYLCADWLKPFIIKRVHKSTRSIKS